MPTPLAQAFVRFRPEKGSFKTEAEKEIDSVDGTGAGKRVGKRFGGGVGSGLKSTIANISGVLLGAGIVKFGKDSIQAFSEAQEGQKRLSDAFDRFPKLADTNQAALQKLNSALQKKTKYDDDNIASGQAVLAQFGVTGQQLKATTPLLLDYASKTGKDIPAAAQDVGKALLGNAKALKNIGIKYTATGDTQKDFTNITALMRAQVGGFATKEGTTAAGQLAILKNQFGEVEEGVGSKLVPALTSLVGALTSVAIFVSGNINVIGPLAGIIGTLVIGIWAINSAAKAYAATQAALNLVMSAGWIPTLFKAIAAGATWLVQVTVIYARVLAYAIAQGAATVATGAWSAAQWLLNAALSANPIGLVIAAIALLVVGLIIAWKHSQTFRDIVLGALHGIQVGFWATVHAIQTAWGFVYGYVIHPIATAAVWIAGKLGAIVGWFKGLPGHIGTALLLVGDFITAPFRSAFNKIADLWNGTVGRLSFTIPSWVPDIGGKGFTMPKLPHLAAGTKSFAGGLALFGERGPEIGFVPPGTQMAPHGRMPSMAGAGGPLVHADQINVMSGSADDVGERIWFRMLVRGM